MLKRLRASLRDDEQLHQKLAGLIGGLVALYLLNKLEAVLKLLLVHVATTYLNILIVVLLVAILLGMYLFRQDLASLARQVEVPIWLGLVAVIVVVIAGLAMSGGDGNEHLNRLGQIKQFSLSQFKIEGSKRVPVTNDLATNEHLNDLKKNINLIVKSLNKRLNHKNSTINADERYLDGELVAAFNYMNANIPLFMSEPVKQPIRSASRLQNFVGAGVMLVAAYLLLRALMWLVLNEINSQLKQVEEEEPQEIIAKVADVQAELEKPVEPVEIVEDEVKPSEPLQVVVEVCLSCQERIKQETERLIKEEAEMIEAARTISPIPKYPGGSSFDDLENSQQDADQLEDTEYPSEKLSEYKEELKISMVNSGIAREHEDEIEYMDEEEQAPVYNEETEEMQDEEEGAYEDEQEADYYEEGEAGAYEDEEGVYGDDEIPITDVRL